MSCCELLLTASAPQLWNFRSARSFCSGLTHRKVARTDVPGMSWKPCNVWGDVNDDVDDVDVDVEVLSSSW